MKKLGFWPVFALVTGSQIGTGVLMLPASLAPYGFYSFGGWLASGLGAIFLALVFAKLCGRFPKTGGPHTYVQMAFGDKAGFLTAWTYWLVSWVSTAAVIICCIGYLTPLIGDHGSMVRLALQLLLLFTIIALNLRGVEAAGSAEVFFSSLKVIPLFLLPLLALFCFKSKNIHVLMTDITPMESILRTTLLTMWGFIGLECATTPAGSVETPHKTIPRAVVAGTIFVAFLYVFNSFGIMGVLPAEILKNSQAPYAQATEIIFGSNSAGKIISLIASVICIGTLNAWVLSSSQVALGASQDGFFPKFFQKRNARGAAYWSIVGSSIGLIPILVLTANDNIAKQILDIIDISVTAFLFVYLLCCFSLMCVLKRHGGSKWDWLIAIGGSLFCVVIIAATPLRNLLIAGLLPATGLLKFLKRKVTA